MGKLTVIVSCFLIGCILAVAGCSSSEAITDPVYIKTLYSWNGTGWQTVVGGGGGGGAETDPIFIASPAFGITAANIITWNTAEGDPIFTASPSFGITAPNIAAWNALVGSQWTTDVNGITYSPVGGGSIGVNTPSVSTSLVKIYANSGATTNPVLEVTENSASAGSTSLYVSNMGAKTGDTIGIHIDNWATSSTANKNKYGLKVSSGAAWDGANSTNYGIYVEEPTGGTTNITAFLSGQLEMSQIGTEPSSKANRAGIYAWDLSTDNATIGFYTETAVEPALGIASTNRMPIRWNGATYYLLAEATGFFTPIVSSTPPEAAQGLRVGTLFFSTDNNTWMKCLSINPTVWQTLPSGDGVATWGSITGNISSQTDLQGALDGKENAGAVTTHEETYVHSDIAHSNRTTLDSIQEALTTSLKTSYDWLVTNITSVWKTAIDDHVASTSNPHSVTANQVLPSQTGQGGKFLKTDGSNSSWDTAGGGASWGSITGSLPAQNDLWNTLAGKVPVTTTVNNHALSANVTVTASDVGLGNVTNDAQIAKAIVDAKGDIITATAADTPTRLASSGVNNQVLTVDTSTATGLKWATPSGGGESESVVVLTGTVANSTVNLANATGIAFTADANSTYIIETFLLWNASASTVGIKVSATASGSPTVQAGHFITDAANGTPDSSSWNANDVVVTTSASAFTTNNVGKVNAILKTSGSASTWQLRFAAETTGTITLQVGSTLRYRKVA